MPESIIFLEARGKTTKAAKISRKMNFHEEFELEKVEKVERTPLTNAEMEPANRKYLIMPLLHLIAIWTNILVLFRAQLFFAGVLTDNPFLSTYLMTIIDVMAYLVTPFLNKILTRKSVFLLYFGLLTLVSVLGVFDGPKLMCFLLRLDAVAAA